MPGILGIISKAPIEERTLEQMLSCMVHRASYITGMYVNKEIGLNVGWITHEGSFSDCMPIWNEKKDVCLILSGEVFMDQNEIVRLKFNGHEYDPENASYLVHLYEEIGPLFVERLNGSFSGLLADLNKKRILLFNDRYGLGRLYYHENKDGFYFASEAKSILKVLPELRSLDMTGLAETFSCGCVLQNRTLFKGLALLPGGALWTVTGRGNIVKESYFSREDWERQPSLDGVEFYRNLKETFTRLLPKYTRGRQKVGMSLTGGLDCRLIMAWLNASPGQIPCYTFGSAYQDSRDVRIAQRVAECCGQTHKTIKVGNEYLKDFADLVGKSIYISDGTMDVTGSVELFVNKIANAIAPVRLTGNYGSEIVRGNVAFKPKGINADILAPEFACLVQDSARTYERERQGNLLTFIAFKQVPWHHYSRLAIEQSQITMRSPYLDNDLVSLMYRAPQDQISNPLPVLRLIEEGNPEMTRIPTDRSLLYRPTPLATKGRQVYEEFTVKAEYAYDYGMSQWLATIDHILAPFHLEKLFLGMHKFYHFRVWYRDQLSNYVKALILDARTLNRPYFNGKRLESMVNDHVKGHRNYTREIHRVLTTELIQRTLLERDYCHDEKTASEAARQSS
jgi:asparagine synthase (glutamine-hydrolysing)